MTDLPNVGLYRRMTALALVAAPAIFLLDNLIHPKEFARDNEARQLAEIAEHYDRWQIAHALGFIAMKESTPHPPHRNATRFSSTLTTSMSSAESHAGQTNFGEAGPSEDTNLSGTAASPLKCVER